MNSGTENFLLASAGVIRFTSADSTTMSNINFSTYVCRQWNVTLTKPANLNMHVLINV